MWIFILFGVLGVLFLSTVLMMKILHSAVKIVIYVLIMVMLGIGAIHLYNNISSNYRIDIADNNINYTFSGVSGTLELDSIKGAKVDSIDGGTEVTFMLKDGSEQVVVIPKGFVSEFVTRALTDANIQIEE